MATIKPPRTKTKGKPAKKNTSRNLQQPDSDVTKPLQFKVPTELHTEFKTYAAMNNMTMLELFIDSYQAYKTNH